MNETVKGGFGLTQTVYGICVYVCVLKQYKTAVKKEEKKKERPKRTKDIQYYLWNINWKSERVQETAVSEQKSIVNVIRKNICNINTMANPNETNYAKQTKRTTESSKISGKHGAHVCACASTHKQWILSRLSCLVGIIFAITYTHAHRDVRCTIKMCAASSQCA